MGGELSVRIKWARASHAEPSLSISRIIATVDRKRTIWTTFREFRGRGEGSRPSQVDPKGGEIKHRTIAQHQLYRRKKESELQGGRVMEPEIRTTRRSKRFKIPRPGLLPAPH